VIFIHPQPSEGELRELYSAEYFSGGDFRCGHESGYCEEETLEHIVNVGLLREIRRMKLGGTFLEIGCAGGAFLQAAQESGFEVQGVEFSEDASRIARQEFGLSVFTGSIEDAHFEGGRFDVVFMGDVIEHLGNPVAALREVHRILARGGVLAMELPSQTNSLYSRIGFLIYGVLGKSATVALPPYHLFEYRPRSLRYLLRETGFEVERLHQGIISPRKVNVRGPIIQRLAKKFLQYPNWALTRGFGALGDRITVLATKKD
jgi:2-polyprenyl-3-methyl-5-hydroxy-6-metoxy-1,4-benzoquinol methylase